MHLFRSLFVIALCAVGLSACVTVSGGGYVDGDDGSEALAYTVPADSDYYYADGCFFLDCARPVVFVGGVRGYYVGPVFHVIRTGIGHIYHHRRGPYVSPYPQHMHGRYMVNGSPGMYRRTPQQGSAPNTRRIPPPVQQAHHVQPTQPHVTHPVRPAPVQQAYTPPTRQVQPAYRPPAQTYHPPAPRQQQQRCQGRNCPR